MARSGLLLVLAAAAAGVAGTGVFPAPASATWPGENGRILFSSAEDMTPEPPLARAADCAGLYSTFLSSVAPDGSGADTIAPGGILAALSPAGTLAYFDVGTDCNGYMSPPDYPLRVREPGTGGERTTRTFHDFRALDPDTARLAWDRQSRTMIHSRRGRIMSVDPQDGSSRLLAKGASATWSSGDELAFTRRQPRSPKARLLVMSGGHTRTLTSRDATSPDWSPDGRWIAFTRRSFRRGAPRRSAVYVIGRDGRGLRRLTGGSVRYALTPVWSPDGQWIAFIRARLSGNALVVVRADGTQAHALVRHVVEPVRPVWEALPAAAAAVSSARGDTYTSNELRGVVAASDGTSTVVWSRYPGDRRLTVFSSWRDPAQPLARAYPQPWRELWDSTSALAADGTLTEAWIRGDGGLRARRLSPEGLIGPTVELRPRHWPSDLIATAAPDGSATMVWNESIVGSGEYPSGQERLMGQRIDAAGSVHDPFELVGPHDDPLDLEELVTSPLGKVGALLRVTDYGNNDNRNDLVLALEGASRTTVVPAAPGPVAMDLAADGGAYVAWGAEAGGQTAVFGRSVSAAGVLGPVVSVSPLMDDVDVLAATGGTALVAWSRMWKTTRRVVVRGIGPGGVPGPAVQVGTGVLRALGRAGAGAVVVWTDDKLERHGTTVLVKTTLHMRRVTMDGTPGTDIVVRRAMGIDFPIVGAAGDGSLVLAWSRPGSNGEVIEARQIHADGSTVGPLTPIAWPLRVTVGQLPAGCLRRRATVHVETTAAPTDRIKRIRAAIDGRAVADSRHTRLRVAVRPHELAPGRHRLRVVATTVQGEKRTVTRGFRACR